MLDFSVGVSHISRCMGNPTNCIGENREADQRLCFRYTNSAIPLRLKSEISSFLPSSVTVQSGYCRTYSETKIFGFVMHELTLQPVWKCNRLKVSHPMKIRFGTVMHLVLFSNRYTY